MAGSSIFSVNFTKSKKTSHKYKSVLTSLFRDSQRLLSSHPVRPGFYLFCAWCHATLWTENSNALVSGKPRTPIPGEYRGIRPGVPTKWSKFPAMRGNFLCQNLIFVLRPRGNTWKITNTQSWPKLIYFKNCASNWTLTKTFSMSSQNRWNNHGFLYSSW